MKQSTVHSRKVSRWITIAKVVPGFVVIRNCGAPGGFKLQWKGRVHPVFQPHEFICWEHVMWAVVRRLELAGMKLLATLKEPAGVMGLYDYGFKLRVLVGLRPGGRLKFRQEKLT